MILHIPLQILGLIKMIGGMILVLVGVVGLIFRRQITLHKYSVDKDFFKSVEPYDRYKKITNIVFVGFMIIGFIIIIGNLLSG